MSKSSKGDVNAFSAASTTLSLWSGVETSPRPIIALPLFSRMVRTSAKSRLTKPGLVMSSVIPLTALARTMSLALKAELSGRSATK